MRSVKDKMYNYEAPPPASGWDRIAAGPLLESAEEAEEGRVDVEDADMVGCGQYRDDWESDE